jgi:hypothetical protein
MCFTQMSPEAGIRLRPVIKVTMLKRVGAVAEIIKIDADILNLRKKLQDKESKELRSRIDQLVKKRQELLLVLEKQARDRIR